MRLRILCLVLATSLVAFIALPAVAEGAGTPAEARPGSAQLQSATFDDVGDGQLRLLALVGPVVAIGVLSILGLTITFGALRHDMRQRRVVYWPRGY